MELLADLGDLRLRTLTGADAALLVEATQAESGRTLWGPHPAGPYSLEDARAALQAWDPRRHGQVSFGALQGETLTTWAHTTAGLTRLWLEINPDNTPSLRLAQRAGYRLEQRLPHHCRAWVSDDPEHDTWHDCLIWVHIHNP
jgi:hypothetical protein